jgi:hypothetical protein
VGQAGWGDWVGIGITLVVLVLCLRALWHLPVIQALWVTVRYPPGTDPSKVRIHLSGRRQRRLRIEAQAERARQLRLELAALNEFIPHVSTYRGVPNSFGISLAPGEWIVARITDTGLIENVSSGGSWMGGTNALSIPVGHHGLRLAHGRSVGQFVKAPPSPSVTDVGTTLITNSRLLFEGSSHTRECRFEHLVGYGLTPNCSGVSVSVSNREEPVRIAFGPELGPWFSIRLGFAIAQFRGEIPSYLVELKNRLQIVNDVVG